MKILQIISSVNPAGGGPIEGVRQLGSTLANRGHEVEVVSLDPPDSHWTLQFPLPLYALGPPMLGYGFSPRLIPWLRSNHTRYDVVVVNGIWQYHSYASWRVLRNSGTPYVVFTHGMLDPWFKRRYPLKHFKKWMYWPWAEYRVLRDAQAVLFTCEEERLLARQSFWLYRCNEVVVNFGTARPGGDPQIEVNRFFECHPELRGKKLALFMGRIHPKKGCDLLIEAFARVLAEHSEWHLVLAGPDQVGWQSKLQQQAQRLGIESRITWTGMIRGAMKWGALRAAEVFVLPSHQENFGIVVAEALAAGTPTLISNKVNIWREIERDGAGLVADDTLTGTCEVFRSYIRMPEEQRVAMSQHASRCFEQRFEIKKTAEALYGTLAGVTGVKQTVLHQA